MPSHYSKADMKRAAAAIVAHGTSIAASKATGIPASTIREWRQNNEPFQLLCSSLEAEFGAEIRAEMAQIVKAASSHLRDRLENGDVQLDAKTGEQVRVPVKARDVAVILGISFDKLRLIENQPTQITQQANVQALADQLVAISEASRVAAGLPILP